MQRARPTVSYHKLRTNRCCCCNHPLGTAVIRGTINTSTGVITMSTVSNSNVDSISHGTPSTYVQTTLTEGTATATVTGQATNLGDLGK